MTHLERKEFIDAIRLMLGLDPLYRQLDSGDKGLEEHEGWHDTSRRSKTRHGGDQ